MTASLIATCATCDSPVSEDDRTCPRCGAVVSVFRVAQRTPLILPGNPALSADSVRATISPTRILAGSAAGAVAVFAFLYFTSSQEPEPVTPPLASGIQSVSENSASAAVVPQLPSSASDSSIPAASAPLAPAATTLPPIPATAEAATLSGSVAPGPRTPTMAAPAVASREAPPIAAPAKVSQPAAPPAATAVPTRRPATVAAASALPGPRTTAAPPATSAPAPRPATLRLATLISDTLRPGALLQLRWTVVDRATGRAVPAAIEFTSADAKVAQVDRRTGLITARAPGRVRVIADAGGAGEESIQLTVLAAPRPATVTVAPSEPLQARSEAARSVSTLPSTPTAAAAPFVTAPVVSAPPAATPREITRSDVLDADDVRSAVDRFVTQVRSGSVQNAGLVGFFSDGAAHRAVLAGAPVTSSADGNSVRASFEVRLTKFDAAGRPVTRIAPVSLDIGKRQGEVRTSAVSISALRKP